MKYFPAILFVVCSFLNISAQDKLSLVEKMFLDLPDTVFTHAIHSMFLKTDSFTVNERRLLLDSGSLASPRSVRLEFDSANLIRFGNGVYFVGIKVWKAGPSKFLLGMINTVSDFVESSQSYSFYRIENGKYSLWKKPLPDCLPLNLFFTETALLKSSIAVNETFCEFHYQFSEEDNAIVVTLQESAFEADYASDKRLTKLDLRKMRREKLYYKFVNGKFVRTEKK